MNKNTSIVVTLMTVTACLALLQVVYSQMNRNNKDRTMMNFVLTSAAFKDGETIAKKYTCDGDDISPSLSWDGFPNNTQSFAIICDDPDAQKVAGKVWVHWLVYDIPSTVKSLPENVSEQYLQSIDAKQGENDFKKSAWGGPCPPHGQGKHRYVFKLYALNAKLKLEGGVRKQELLDAMKDHILATAELTGLYERSE